MIIRNLTTQQVYTFPCDIGGVKNVTWENGRDLILADGGRIDPGEPPIADGYTRTACTFADGDGVNGQWQVTDSLTADIEAEARAAKLATLTPELIQHAALFRLTLRRHFGDGAETNRDVTAGAVAAHFTAQQVAGTITATDLADAVMLDKMFTELAAWTGDGTSWTFPWEAVP